MFINIADKSPVFLKAGDFFMIIVFYHFAKIINK